MIPVVRFMIPDLPQVVRFMIPVVRFMIPDLPQVVRKTIDFLTTINYLWI
jgi:hypothetical protein